MKNFLVIFGTRPEAIKLAPVIIALRRAGARVSVCNTEQQKQLSHQALGFFGLQSDICLDVMRPSQQLASTQSRMLAALEGVFAKGRFDAAIVQGDTLSVLSGALAAFYARVPVAHIEAGLRSHDLAEPFPEEAVRAMVARIASYHFAPTQQAFAALERECAPGELHLVGNTCIDALGLITAEHREAAQAAAERLAAGAERCVLVTAHRRENLGERLESIISAVAELAAAHALTRFIWPLHPNPAVCERVRARLAAAANVTLCDALEYPELVAVLARSALVLTDSGGLQEEAPSFGLRVCVLREQTERPEGVAAGFSELLGADSARIVAAGTAALAAPGLGADGKPLAGRANPYGDGTAAQKIAQILMERA